MNENTPRNDDAIMQKQHTHHIKNRKSKIEKNILCIFIDHTVIHLHDNFTRDFQS